MNKLSLKKKLCVRYRIQKCKFLEYVRFDSCIASLLLSIFYFFKYCIVRLFQGEFKSLIIAGNAFRHTRFQWIRKLSTKILKYSISRHGSQMTGTAILKIVSKKIDEKILVDLKQSIIEKSVGLFHRRLLILSPPTEDKKGVIIIKFTNYFKYVLNIFNMRMLEQDYILVVEPSFSGYFDEDILCLLSVNIPIIIQSPEPIDYDFIQSFPGNMYPINVGANCWVDHRIFYPKNDKEKEFDIVMVSIWADFKRHYHLFESISKSTNRNIKIALVGKPWPKTLNDIMDEAKYYNVYNNMIYYEGINQTELNDILNKSKSYLLLSKKEGINKSIIEAMNSGVPVFILEGFNYGYNYPFINSTTGAFINKYGLVNFLNNFAKYELYKFNPNKWVQGNITPHISTKMVVEAIENIEKDRSISVNKNLAIKVNNPELDYWDYSLWREYEVYYNKLSEYLN